MSKEIYINFLDYYLPKKIETNLSILQNNYKSKKDSLEMIKKIGINSRHIADNSTTSNTLAEKVVKKIFNKFNKNNIDFLLYCTNSPDYILPPNACLLQNKLGLKKNIGSFDINLSCSGFIYSLGLAKSLIYSNQAKNVLLITSDTYSRFIEKKNINIIRQSIHASKLIKKNSILSKQNISLMRPYNGINPMKYFKIIDKYKAKKEYKKQEPIKFINIKKIRNK